MTKDREDQLEKLRQERWLTKKLIQERDRTEALVERLEDLMDEQAVLIQRQQRRLEELDSLRPFQHRALKDVTREYLQVALQDLDAE